ncbi:MAG: homoserine kinase [Opitutaceae bacterium]|nr:homoserine kinase [Opitutaceae bacterium]
MKPALDTVCVRVPGSTSNCGAGFDTLGLALNLHNDLRVTLVAGARAQAARPGDARAQTLVEAAAAAYFARTGGAPFGFSYQIDGDVPLARGLGSSVTVYAGVIAGLAALAGTPMIPHDIITLVTALEGHPDNAAAGVLGGFCVARSDPVSGAYVGAVRFEVPAELAFVVASPQVEILTKESRGALPPALPFFDAVRSINSAAYLVAAFAARDYAKLRQAVRDYMHEPYRLPRIAGGRAAIDAGVETGAYTGWLSGSGSSVLCVCPREQAAGVQAAMSAAFASAGVKSDVRLLAGENAGLRLG